MALRRYVNVSVLKAIPELEKIALPGQEQQATAASMQRI